jgi:hypothetical protein
MRKKLATALQAAAAVAVMGQSALAAVNFTGTAYQQDFNTLPTSGSAVAWTNDSTLQGWSIFKQPEPGTPIPTIAAGAGTSTTGAIYSFGDSDERAFGGVGSGNANYYNGAASGSVAAWIALALTNSTGSTIDSATLSFDGEQWRNGGNASAQTMILEYGLGGSFETVPFWTAPGGLFDFTSPITGTSGSALNGNDSANRVADLGGELTGLAWPSGETLWLRWVEKNDTGNDHGLAIDDLEFSVGTVEPPTDNADFNGDQVVDGQDFLIWQRGYGAGSTLAEGNANSDGAIDDADLQIWQEQFGVPASTVAIGAVPEPASLGLAALGMVAALSVSRRRA